MSVKALQEYTRYSRYARFLPEKKRRENWKEQTTRVFNMHREKYGDLLDAIKEDIDFTQDMMQKKFILGSQRALQFGGYPILAHETKMYNCAGSYVDRVRFFQECMYLLLCGCGTGFSVQKHHIAKLPGISRRTKGKKVFVVQDSIEGWADAIGVLVSSYFNIGPDDEFAEYHGYEVVFDFSQVRPEGAPISWGGIAPGPKGLARSVEKIAEIFDARLSSNGSFLRPIDAYDIIMHASDAVLSGGIRRSATICLFSPDDEEMMNAKTGNWLTTNPQRGRSNNSALLVREKTTFEEFAKIIESTRQCGEPGFVWADSTEVLYNPCCEISFYCYDEFGNSGWQFCNLVEMNMKKAKDVETFYEMCRAAGVLGTIQAGYTSFKYLREASRRITEREALLGVSMTGMMDNPEIAFDPEIQRRGAEIILEVNERIAKALGINPCARATCVKPAGSTSCLLGTASGIHPHHALRYFRLVQANKNEVPLQFFQLFNPDAVEESVWSNNKTDMVIRFLCEVPPGAKVKNQLSAVELLDHVKLTQNNWVEAGTRLERCSQPWLRHNVSNTITVKNDEWEELTEYIYNNRDFFAGISLLPESGDKDYPQAPFTAVYTPMEMVKMYGDGSLFASGLIVHAHQAFDDNLWAACATLLGIGEDITEAPDKQKWVARAKRFANRYFEGDLKRMTYCLKDVNNWKLWCDLKRTYVEVDWDQCVEDNYQLDVTTLAAAACQGGKCEI